MIKEPHFEIASPLASLGVRNDKKESVQLS